MTEAQQIDFRRVRIMAAVVLAVGSASVGFLGGWLSARLVPTGTQSAAVADREAPAQAASPSEPSKAKEARQDTSTASMTSDGTSTDSAEKAAEPSKAEKGQTDTAAARDTQKVEETHGGATVINAGSADKNATLSRNPPNTDVAKAPSSDVATDRSSERLEPDAAVGRSADQETLERCARRYSSFRASDGTYQPYDGGPRKLCSLLR